MTRPYSEVSQLFLKSRGQETETLKLPTITLGVVACTFTLSDNFRKPLLQELFRNHP